VYPFCKLAVLRLSRATSKQIAIDVIHHGYIMLLFPIICWIFLEIDLCIPIPNDDIELLLFEDGSSNDLKSNSHVRAYRSLIIFCDLCYTITKIMTISERNEEQGIEYK